jgi:hypothetical protein
LTVPPRGRAAPRAALANPQPPRAMGNTADCDAGRTRASRCADAPLFRRSPGPPIQNRGDAFYAAFDTASDAVAAALAAQRALHREPWPAGAKLNVRMALHSGAIRCATETIWRTPEPGRASSHTSSWRLDTCLRIATYDFCQDDVATARELKAARCACFD